MQDRGKFRQALAKFTEDNSAKEFLDEMLETDFWGFIDSCTDVLEERQTDILTTRALIGILSVLRPSRDGDIGREMDEKSKVWLKEGRETSRQNLRTALNIYLYCPERTLKKLTAACLALIGCLEGFTSMLNTLIDRMMSEGSDIEYIMGAMRTCVELFRMPIVTDETIKEQIGLTEKIRVMLVQAAVFFSDSQFQDSLRMDEADLILRLIKRTPSIFYEGGDGMLEYLTNIISYCGDLCVFLGPESHGTGWEKLCHTMNLIVYNIVRRLPSAAPVFQTIVDVICLQMESSEPVVQLECAALCRDLVEYTVKQSQSGEGFDQRFADLVLANAGRFCQQLGTVKNPDDVDIESLEYGGVELHMVSQEALRMLFSLEQYQSGVLTAVEHYISDTMEKDMSWVDQHGILLAITCVCGVAGTPPLEASAEFVLNQVEFLIQSSMSEVPRVRETAMWAICCAIRSYPRHILDPDRNGVDFFMRHAIAIAQQDPELARRSCALIYEICVNTEGPELDPYMEECIAMLLDIAKTFSHSEAFYALDALLARVSGQSDSDIHALLTLFVSSLGDNSWPPEIKRLMCSTISVIVNKLRPSLTERDTVIAQLLSVCDNPIVEEEALIALSSILGWTRSELPNAHAIFTRTIKSLSNHSPTLSPVCLDIIAKLCMVVPTYMSSNIDEAIGAIRSVISLGLISSEMFYVSTARCLAQTLRIYSDAEENCGSITELVMKMSNLLMQMLTSRSDLSVTPALVTSIVSCYTSLFGALQAKPDFLLDEVINPCFRLVDAFVKWLNVRDVEPNDVSEDVLHEFCCLFVTVGRILKQKVNVKLHKSSVRILVDLALKCKDDQVREEAPRVQAFIAEL